MKDIDAKVLSSDVLAEGLIRIILHAPEIAKDARPGQFIHMLVPDNAHVLRRPISLMAMDAAAGTLTLAIQPKGRGTQILCALKPGDSASQPLDLPSAGSAFKRPAGGYAAALIDEAGLKGFRVGNAAISQKHAGFAVNLGGATAAEVKELLQTVSDKVFAQFGIRLEPEIRIW